VWGLPLVSIGLRIVAAARRHPGKITFLILALLATLIIRLTDSQFAPPVDAAVPQAGPAGEQLAALPPPRPADRDMSSIDRPSATATSDTSPEPGADGSESDADAEAASTGGANPDTIEEVVEIQRGDTLIEVLVNAGVRPAEAYDAVDALTQYFAPRDLRPGQEIALTLSPAAEMSASGLALVGLSLQPSVERNLQVTRSLDGGFTALEVDRTLMEKMVSLDGHIDSSLFEAAQQAGMPISIMTQLIRAFSFDVDFQREIQPGDSFEVLYDQYNDEDGNFAKTGDLVYASLTLSGTKFEIYRFTPESGIADYFNPRGESVRKALLRTPVDGARITSGFGMRMHPILGYSKMHKGVDFGAPTGTPIFAAGDGVIAKLGRLGGYGNYVQIRHNSEYATAYAHMSRFAKGLHVGSHVHQGDVIGYVGATGRATGPHLHYEVLLAGKQINPQSVKLPAGEKLKGVELAAFETTVAETDALRERTRAETRIAEAPIWSPSDCTASPPPEVCN
jgi:murein DD-endopeptidase MepM/ murein hydrolase activator NlpD